MHHFPLASRDIQDKTVGTLSQRISGQLLSLHGLQTHLEGIRDYLQKVANRKLPINHQILYHLQDIFNLLPNLNLEEFTKAFAVKTNDQLLVVYLASLIRSVIALHNLIGNKIANHKAEMRLEKEGDKKREEKAAKKEAVEGKEGEKTQSPHKKDKETDGKKSDSKREQPDKK